MEGFLESLSKLEQHLLEANELLVVRGKRGRGVPVLIPADICDLLNCLAEHEVRKSVAVDGSPYLFPNFGKIMLTL